MTYHLERTTSLPTNLKLDFDRKVRFPEKLWEALDDPSAFLHWAQDGKSLIADEKRFEDTVMKRYPGLVQIASFLNFRRQLREYGFDWTAHENNVYGFFHPEFVRGRLELMRGVLTKRKSYNFDGQTSYSSTAVDSPHFRIRPSYKRSRTRTFYRYKSPRAGPGPGRPVKIRRCSSNNLASDVANEGNPTKILKITVDLTVPPSECFSHDDWSMCSSPPSGRYHADRGTPQCVPPQSRLSSYARHSVTAPRVEPETDEWRTFCAPWGPSEEPCDMLPNCDYLPSCENAPYVKTKIPVLFYDDNQTLGLDKTEWEFGLEGQPRITVANEQIDSWQYQEIRYYYAL